MLLSALQAPIVEAFEMAVDDVRPEPLRTAGFVPSRYQREWIEKRLTSPPNNIQDGGVQTAVPNSERLANAC